MWEISARDDHVVQNLQLLQFRKRQPVDARFQSEMAGRVVGIWGYGGIGRETARLCNEFGMRVIGIEARVERELPNVELHEPDELDRYLPEADFVVSTVPHTPETEGIWNAERFKIMKSSAYLINIGRGRTMKIDELADAIESGVIAGCGLDVFEEEPLPRQDELRKLPNVFLTSHIAAVSAEKY